MQDIILKPQVLIKMEESLFMIQLWNQGLLIAQILFIIAFLNVFFIQESNGYKLVSSMFLFLTIHTLSRRTIVLCLLCALCNSSRLTPHSCFYISSAISQLTTCYVFLLSLPRMIISSAFALFLGTASYISIM